MAPPDDPTLANIEDDLADLHVMRATLRDMTQHWGHMDTAAALAIIEQGFEAVQRMHQRTKARHTVFKRQWKEGLGK